MVSHEEQKIENSLGMEKRVKIQTEHAVVLVELKGDRSLLFARLIIVCQSRPEINVEEVISKYEFSVVPCALFAADAALLS